MKSLLSLLILLTSPLVLADVPKDIENSPVAIRGELDSEGDVTNIMARAQKNLPKTLVIRQNEKTGEIQVVHLDIDIEPSEEMKVLLAGITYTKIDPNKKYEQTDFEDIDTLAELDQDSSRESWYFWGGYGSWGGWYGWGGMRWGYRSYWGGWGMGGWNYGCYRW